MIWKNYEFQITNYGLRSEWGVSVAEPQDKKEDLVCVLAARMVVEPFLSRQNPNPSIFALPPRLGDFLSILDVTEFSEDKFR